MTNERVLTIIHFTLSIIHYVLNDFLLNYLYFCTLFKKSVLVIRRSASTYNGTF